MEWRRKTSYLQICIQVFFFGSLSSWKIGASPLVWLVVIKARRLFIWKIKQKLDKQIKAEKDHREDHFLWILLFGPNPLMFCNCRITLRKGGKCLEGGKNALAFGSGSQTFSGAVKRQGCSLSHWEVPVGQTEMLWFPFKMLLYLGDWRKGVSTWSHVTMAFHCLEFLTTVKRLNAVMSVLPSEDIRLQQQSDVIIWAYSLCSSQCLAIVNFSWKVMFCLHLRLAA